MPNVPSRWMLGLDPTPGFDPAAFLATLLTTGRALEQSLDRELAERGLPPSREAHALLFIGRGRARRVPIGDLARRIVLSPSATTRMVERMEARGLVRRETGRTDRRANWVVLEDEGVHILRKVRSAARHVVRARLLGRIDVRAMTRLQRDLERANRDR